MTVDFDTLSRGPKSHTECIEADIKRIGKQVRILIRKTDLMNDRLKALEENQPLIPNDVMEYFLRRLKEKKDPSMLEKILINPEVYRKDDDTHNSTTEEPTILA